MSVSLGWSHLEEKWCGASMLKSPTTQKTMAASMPFCWFECFLLPTDCGYWPCTINGILCRTRVAVNHVAVMFWGSAGWYDVVTVGPCSVLAFMTLWCLFLCFDLCSSIRRTTCQMLPFLSIYVWHRSSLTSSLPDHALHSWRIATLLSVKQQSERRYGNR